MNMSLSQVGFTRNQKFSEFSLANLGNLAPLSRMVSEPDAFLRGAVPHQFIGTACDPHTALRDVGKQNLKSDCLVDGITHVLGDGYAVPVNIPSYLGPIMAAAACTYCGSGNTTTIDGNPYCNNCYKYFG